MSVESLKTLMSNFLNLFQFTIYQSTRKCICFCLYKVRTIYLMAYEHKWLTMGKIPAANTLQLKYLQLQLKQLNMHRALHSNEREMLLVSSHSSIIFCSFFLFTRWTRSRLQTTIFLLQSYSITQTNSNYVIKLRTL